MEKYIREEMIDELVERLMDNLDDKCVANILREGCEGYDNMNDREILEHFCFYCRMDSMPEDAFIFINSEGKELEVELVGDSDNCISAGIKIDNVVDDYQYL